MRCPFCVSSSRTKVLETRDLEDKGQFFGVRRRRKCLNCKVRFSTEEQLRGSLWVIKQDGKEEDFQIAKLQASIRAALHKLPQEKSSAEVSKKIYQDLLKKSLGEARRRKITSATIARLVISALDGISEKGHDRYVMSCKDSIRENSQDTVLSTQMDFNLKTDV